VFVYSGDWACLCLWSKAIKVSTQQQTKNTEDRIKQFEILVLHLTGFSRGWKKVPPFEKKPARPRKVSKKSEPGFWGVKCARFPLWLQLSWTPPRRVCPKLQEKFPSASGRRIILWSSKEFSPCRFVAPVVQAKATSQQSFS
jgi:hypothetical protein